MMSDSKTGGGVEHHVISSDLNPLKTIRKFSIGFLTFLITTADYFETFSRVEYLDLLLFFYCGQVFSGKWIVVGQTWSR